MPPQVSRVRDLIPSLQWCVDCQVPAFTQPSFATFGQPLLAWVLLLEFTVAILTRGHSRLKPDACSDQSLSNQSG